MASTDDDASGLGTGHATKSDEFSEKFQRGAGSFSIQKIILQILDLYNGLLFGRFLKKNWNLHIYICIFRKWRGWSSAVWIFFPKIRPIWWRDPSLRQGTWPQYQYWYVDPFIWYYCTVSSTNYFQIVRRQWSHLFSQKSNTAMSRRFLQKLLCLMLWKNCSKKIEQVR